MSKLLLTIDDGPSNSSLERLELLNSHQQKAIWYCLGENLETFRTIAIELIKNGQHLGNHSWDHPHFAEISWEDGKRQILKTDALLDDLYREAGVERAFRFFRFPYGENTAPQSKWKVPFRGLYRSWRSYQSFLSALGYQELEEICQGELGGFRWPSLHSLRLKDVDSFWTLDSNDWQTKGMEPEEFQHFFAPFLAKCLRLETQRKKQVVLLHDHEDLVEQFAYLLSQIYGESMKKERASSP